MGKKQHQKDKMYLTSTEWSTLYGGKKAGNFLDQFTRLGDFEATCRLGAVYGVVHCMNEKNTDDETDRRMYTLKRLIKGLASSNRCARIGFSDALAEVLRRVDYTTEEIQSHMNELLPLNSKEDRVQMLIGRLFVWGAIIRASKITDHAAVCVADLLLLGEKSYLVNVVCNLFKKLIETMDKSTFKSQVWPSLRTFLSKSSNASFKLFLLLTLKRHYVKLFNEINGQSVLDKPEALSSALQMSTSQLPQLHPVIPAIVEHVEAENLHEEFWGKIALKLTENPSVEKHYLLLHLVKGAFMSQENLKHLMTETYVDLLIFPLVKSNSPLHPLAKSMLTDIGALAPTKSKSILKFLLSSPKGYRFDHMTKSSLVHNTVAKACPDTVRWYAKKLQKKLEELQAAPNDENHLKFDTIIIEQLANLTHLSCMHNHPDFKKSVCEFLASNYFNSDAKISKKPNMQAFLKAVAPSNSAKGLQDAAENIEAILHIYLHMENRHPSFKHEKKIKAASKVVKKLNKSDKDADSKLALRIFVGYLSLAYALNILQDVTVLDDVMSSAKAFMAGRQEEDEVEWIDLVMEALVSALSVENALFRNMILMTFALVHKEITSDALAILLSVFKSDAVAEDLTQLEEEATDEESDESDSDEEMDDESEAKKSEESGSEVDFADAAFRNQLSTVLGVEGSDDEGEVVATDEDMIRLDKAISAAFGARFKSLSSTNNKEKKKRELQALHFEMKCLNIIDAYVKSSNISMLHLVEICKTLLQFSTSKRVKNHHRPIVSHIADTLRDVSCIKLPTISFDGVETDLLKGLGDLIAYKLKTIFDLELRVVLSSLLPFIIKCVKHVADDSEWYFKLYSEMLELYLGDTATPLGPPVFVRFVEVFDEHCLFIVDSLGASLATCMDKREKRVQVLGLLVAALKLCNTTTQDKKKLKKSLKRLSTAVETIVTTSDKESFTTNVYVELLDLMRLISKKGQDAQIELEQTGDSKTALRTVFDQLSAKNLPSQLKRRLNAVFKHFFPGEQFNLQKRKKEGKQANGVMEVDAEESMEVDVPKKKKKHCAKYSNGKSNGTEVVAKEGDSGADGDEKMETSVGEDADES